MKAFLVAILLSLASPVFAAEVAAPTPPTTTEPTETPPQELPPSDPPRLTLHQVHGPGDLLKLMMGGDDEPEEEAPKLKCDKKPCVFGYRFNGEVNDASAKRVVAFLGAAQEAKADIVMLEINTPGGSVNAGHDISRAIEHVPYKVVCVVDGTSYSMGMYILASCDARVMTKRSTLMIHQVALQGVDGPLDLTTAQDAVVNLTAKTRAYIEWVTHKMKNTSVDDTLKRIYGGHEWFMDWNQALWFGAVDKVIDGTPDKYFVKTLQATGKP